MANFTMRALRDADDISSDEDAQIRVSCFIGDWIEGMLRMLDTGERMAGLVDIGRSRVIDTRTRAHAAIALRPGTSAMRRAES